MIRFGICRELEGFWVMVWKRVEEDKVRVEGGVDNVVV